MSELPLACQKYFSRKPPLSRCFHFHYCLGKWSIVQDIRLFISKKNKRDGKNDFA